MCSHPAKRVYFHEANRRAKGCPLWVSEKVVNSIQSNQEGAGGWGWGGLRSGGRSTRGAPWDWRESQKQHLALCWPWVHLFFFFFQMSWWSEDFFQSFSSHFPSLWRIEYLIDQHAQFRLMPWRQGWQTQLGEEAYLRVPPTANSKKRHEKGKIHPFQEVMLWNWWFASQGWEAQRRNRKWSSE